MSLNVNENPRHLGFYHPPSFAPPSHVHVLSVALSYTLRERAFHWGTCRPDYLLQANVEFMKYVARLEGNESHACIRDRAEMGE